MGRDARGSKPREVLNGVQSESQQPIARFSDGGKNPVAERQEKKNAPGAMAQGMSESDSLARRGYRNSVET